MLLIYAANSTNSCRAYAASNADVHHICAAANMANTCHMYAANMMNARVIYALLILLMRHTYSANNNACHICTANTANISFMLCEH